MIDWFYSDPVRVGFWTGVTNDVQKFLVTSKTIANASNRFRVVSNVVCDDFMQFGEPLGDEQVPARLGATRDASPTIRVRQRGHPAASLGPSHEVAKSNSKNP